MYELMVMPIYLISVLIGSQAYSEVENVITGSPFHRSVGQLSIPGNADYYSLDDSAQIHILENVAIEGAVALKFDQFHLHHRSVVTIRDTKYGGALGRVISRHSSRHPPPEWIISSSCCLRIEFYTGCCQTHIRYRGMRILYKFIRGKKGSGRKSSCRKEKYNRKLCNGECMPPAWNCPCPKYGQYRCESAWCIDRGYVCNGVDNCLDGSDEKGCKKIVRNEVIPYSEKIDAMYAFSPIVTTACSAVGISFLLVCLVGCLDKYTRVHCIDIIKNTRPLKGFSVHRPPRETNTSVRH